MQDARWKVVAWPLLVALLVLATVVNTRAQQRRRPAGSSCTAHDGRPGTCTNILQCPEILRTFRRRDVTPVICGFDGRLPIVCCPAEGGSNGNGSIVDISPPNVSFQCGSNPTSKFTFYLESPGEVQILRPDPPRRVPVASRPLLPSSSSLGPQGGGSGRQRTRPGIPVSAINDRAAQVQRPAPPNQKRPGQGTLEKPSGPGIQVPFVVGGVNAVKNTWPWMALMGKTEPSGSVTWFCAGSLINEQWVLSAVHCFEFVSVDKVRVGEHDYNDDADGARHQDVGVAQLVVHPDYTHSQGYHDLALLQLDRPLTLSRFINPVCLAWGRESDQDVIGNTVTLTGWGDTQFDGQPSSVLQQVDLTVFPPARCDASYSTLLDYPTAWPNGIGQETVCAGHPAGGRDACQGDSGGPIVSKNTAGRYVLAGVVSRGYGCGHKDFPGIYVNMRRKGYLAWIKKTAF